MIAVGHTSVGIVLGVATTELLHPSTLPLPLEIVAVGAAGLASHYLMDLVPHGHYDFNQQGLTRRQKLTFGLDFILPISLVVIYLLASFGLGRISWLVGAGILGSQLPDLLMGLRSKKLLPDWPWLSVEAQFHSQTHWHNPTNPVNATQEGGRKLAISDLWQVAMCALALILLTQAQGL